MKLTHEPGQTLWTLGSAVSISPLSCDQKLDPDVPDVNLISARWTEGKCYDGSETEVGDN